MFSKLNWMIAAVALLGAAITGCTKKTEGLEDPKQTLSAYISKSFAVSRVEDREELMGFLTGEAKTRLVAWSDEQFRHAFIDTKRKFLRLAFTEVKNSSPTEVNITYEISYVDEGKGHNAKVTNKKLGQLVSVNGKWLIRDVHNIKELVEYQNEMSSP